MITLFINDVDRTSDLTRSTISRTNQIQQRADSLEFEIFQGTKPSENQDVKMYVSDEVASIASNVVTLRGYFNRNTSKFWAGQILFIRIGETDMEKVVVDSYDETTLQLTLVSAPVASISAGDLIGELQFGGVISRVKDLNVTNLDNLEYSCECVDYTKIFDKKIVSDSWADVDSRYIINDFVNTTVNYNSTLDNISYADNTAIQAEWIESGTGGNPTVDTSDFLEGSASGVFSWTGAGTAIFTASPTSKDLQLLVGVATGTPTKGLGMLWVEPADYTKITSLKIRIGSDASNYALLTLDTPTSNDWQYSTARLKLAAITGTPDWAAVDYIAIVVAHSATSSMKANGFRVNADNSFTLYNVESTPEFTDFRSPQLKPTALMQTLAKNFQYSWYINYEKDIVFKSSGVMPAPFAITPTSNNFNKLSIEVDQSQLGNRIIVRGGEKTSLSRYAEVKQGNNAQREWLMKSKFNSLEVSVDDGTSTHSAESGTTTTNIKITGHGLSTGDHIINRTRSNAVREITYVDADNFTVETVTSQTNGDNITFFATSKTIGIEGLVDESTVDYVYNSNEKSVRSASQTATLTTTIFIRFEYNERVPIQLQYQDNASSDALKALGFGDGVFDLDPITDRNIQDTSTAIALAQAKVNDFRNPLIKGTLETDQDGLRAGQILNVQDTNRGFMGDYVIQTIRSSVRTGEFDDYFVHRVTFGTTLFGIIEFYQKLLKQKDSIETGIDDVVETYVSSSEDVDVLDADDLALGGFKVATVGETVTSDDSNQSIDFNGAWQWEPSVGQPLETRWNLFSYS